MGRTLAKPWNRAAPGTVITTETEEAYKTGATLVDPARFAHLEAEGFFEPEESADRYVYQVAEGDALPPDLEPETTDVPADVPDAKPVAWGFKGTDKAIPLGTMPPFTATVPADGTVTDAVRAWDRASDPADTSETYPPEITDTQTSIKPRKAVR